MRHFLIKEDIIKILEKRIDNIKDQSKEEEADFLKDIVNNDDGGDILKLCNEFKTENEHALQEIEIVKGIISDINDLKVIKRK